MTRPLPPPSPRTLAWLVALAVAALLLAAGAVLKAVASGSGWLSRHVAASERKE